MGEISNPSLRVLLIDDDEIIHISMPAQLKKLGISDVVSAYDGTEALVCLRDTDPFDLLICDLNMPEMDGIEFLRHLTQQRNFEGGLILMSGVEGRVLAMAAELAAAHNLPILGTLSKPVTGESLTKLLKDFSTKSKQKKSDIASLSIAKADIKRGIAAGEFCLFYQPKVLVEQREVMGVEALVRWHHPQYGLLGPNLFIEKLEDLGLIDALTDAVIKLALHQAGKFKLAGLNVVVSINLSVTNLSQLHLPEFIVDQAKLHEVDPAKITLEVTETKLMRDVVKPLEILSRLTLQGMKLSIDDFGTGFSTMEQLKRVPFSELKIDRIFVHDVVDKPETAAILTSCINLGKTLNMSIVAEGVETQADWDMVKSLDCDIVQGYFIAKPMPCDEIIPWIKAYTAKSSASS